MTPTPAPFSLPVSYYDALVTSEYQIVAPNMFAWLNANLQLFADIQTCLASFIQSFALTAPGIAAFTIAVGGTGYVVNDVVLASQNAALSGTLTITSVDGSGAVLTATVSHPGLGYSVGTGVTMSGGTGANLTINITGVTAAGAIGSQLDVLGAILGQPRTVSFQPTGTSAIARATVYAGGTGYAVGNIVTVGLGGSGLLQVASIGAGGAVTALSLVIGSQGTGYTNSGFTPYDTFGGSGNSLTVNIVVGTGVTPVLDDFTYLILLLCTVFNNHWNGQIDSLQTFWAALFPGTFITIKDYQNMSAVVTLSGWTVTQIMQELFANGLIVPRPQGVFYYLVNPIL